MATDTLHRFGAFGGRYVPETLIPALDELADAWIAARADPAYRAELSLLLDAMRGDATLFTRRDEAEAEWKLITPIEEAWNELPAPKFPNYAAGSGGPEAADLLIARNGWSWRSLDPLG